MKFINCELKNGITILPVTQSTLSFHKPKNCSSTTEVSVTKNFDVRLEFIPNAIFRRLKFLENLSLRNVGLKLINRKTFANANNLKILKLDDNQLKYLENQTFSEVKNLEELSLSGNLIENLNESTFVGLENLKFLKLDFNRIETIHETLFEPLISLEKFIMNHNRIISIPITIFSKSPRLTFIDLSFNKIAVFDCSVFANCSQLETIHLNRNQIARITNANVLENLEGLKIFDLSDNFCIDYLYMFKNLSGFQKDAWNCSENIDGIKQLKILQQVIMEEISEQKKDLHHFFNIVIVLIALSVFLTIAIVLLLIRYLKKRSRRTPFEMKNLHNSRPQPFYENINFRHQFLNIECDTLDLYRSK